jgi:hypothetical protein
MCRFEEFHVDVPGSSFTRTCSFPAFKLTPTIMVTKMVAERLRCLHRLGFYRSDINAEATSHNRVWPRV